MSREYMNPKNLKLTLENVTGGGPMILKQIEPIHPFRDGKSIREEISGRLVTVIVPENGYEHVSIDVSDPTDSLSPLLAKATATAPVYVDFTDAKVTIGSKRKMDGQWESIVKITATSVHVASTLGGDDSFLIDD